MGAAGFLHPSPVFPDEARINEHKHFSQVRELFFDSPVKMHFHPPKKNPRTDAFIDPGISLFYPLDPGRASVREGCSTGPGRSSDFLALSTTFPFRCRNSGALRLKGFPLQKEKGEVTAAGPPPSCTRFPIMPMRAPKPIGG